MTSHMLTVNICVSVCKLDWIFGGSWGATLYSRYGVVGTG